MGQEALKPLGYNRYCDFGES